MSQYLSQHKAFENEISRGVTSSRSKELKALIDAITYYVTFRTEYGILQVRDTWNAWREQDPKEFSSRGIPIAANFERELATECERLGVEHEGLEEEWVAPAIPEARTVTVNRHKIWKKAGKAGATQMGNAYSMAEKGMAIASGAGAKAVLIGGAGLASATGIGGIVVGGVATIAASGFALNSYRKTGSHVKNLVDLWNHKEDPQLRRCAYWDAVANPLLADQGPVDLPTDLAGHDVVANQVLPYLIKQKSRKLARKKVAAIPVFGTFVGVRAMGNNAIKRIKKTQGQARKQHALWLANHVCECDCELSKQIVTELYSVDEMVWLLDQEPQKVADLLAEKMQST